MLSKHSDIYFLLVFADNAPQNLSFEIEKFDLLILKFGDKEAV